MGAFDVEEEETNSLFAFDIQRKSWNFLANCLVPRHDARMVYFDGYLYIIGGFDPTHRTEDGRMLPLKQCHRYHVESGEWRKLPDMEEARCAHAAAIFNGQVLVVGGKDETNRVLSSIERYDFSVGKWKTLSPCLPEPRMSMGCTYHEGKLWIAGGITSDQGNIYVMDSVWNLDHKTCRWTKKASLPIAVAFPTLVSDGNNLFCVGGAIKVTNNQRDELESTDKIYKFEKGAWVEHASMPHPSHSIVGCSIGQTLYLLGGFNSHTMSHFETPFYMQLDEDKKHEDLEFLPLPYKAAGFIAEVTSAELKDK